MANFYKDNDDIRFLFRHYRLGDLAEIMENDFSDAERFDWAPANADEAVENYDRLLDIAGQISGDQIAPRAESVDLQGNTLNDDGSVTYAKGTQENLKSLAQAELMGFTLPHRFGGLNCPSLVYTMTTEIVSRADAALMNIYGLQGIAETINAFASEEIKKEYLPGFAEGKYTGAMVLTEPDAGSDLQAIKVAGYQQDGQDAPAAVNQDEHGNWHVNGVKRFITNGCGEILLVLARSEPEISDGRGLSLFLVERGPKVKVRRLENKLGIHGSPTCELFFNNAPAKLIGERQRGLITYVMSLMNGARVGIAAQSLGIAEAAFRVARNYAASRKQFGSAIEKFPAVRDMLMDMKLDIQAARTLTYETCWTVDLEYGAARKLGLGEITDKDAKKALKQQEKKYKRLAGMLTPMSKYYASEMSNRVAYDAVQVLGGSGYMKDYPAERLARDARITTIYEGTSQLQVIAAVRGVCGGTAEKYLLELEEFPYPEQTNDLAELLKKGRQQLLETVAFVKDQPGTEYMDLHARKIVDVAIMLIVGHLLLRQSVAEPIWRDEFTDTPANSAASGDSDNHSQPSQDAYSAVRVAKAAIAGRYIKLNSDRIKMLCNQALQADRSAMTDYELVVGPVFTE